MSIKHSFVLACLLAASASPAFGQLAELPDDSFFSVEAFSLDFKFFPPREITGPEHTLSAWGVHFAGTADSAPEIRAALTTTFPVPTEEAVLRNMGDGRLVIDFGTPATRVGLWLGNGTPGTQFTLSAYDSGASLLGTLQKTGLADPATFVGVQAPFDRQISKLVVEYDSGEEEIHKLKIDYLGREPFRVILPQLADGPVGSLSFVTTIVISNISNTTSEGELKLFASSDKTTPPPLSLTLTGPDGVQTGSIFPFTLAPFASITFVTQGVGDVSVGYAVISAEAPVEGTAIFTTRNADNSIFREAGVGSIRGLLISTGAVLKVDNLNSGVAVVNTSSTHTADAKVELLDVNGNVVSTNEDILDLAPGGHIARFLGELFPNDVGDAFQGSIVITSDQPLAPVILRAVDGFVVSSLPVGSTEG